MFSFIIIACLFQDNLSDFSTNDLSTSYDLPQPEPPPDYDQVNGSGKLFRILSRVKFSRSLNKCYLPKKPLHDMKHF